LNRSAVIALGLVSAWAAGAAIAQGPDTKPGPGGPAKAQGGGSPSAGNGKPEAGSLSERPTPASPSSNVAQRFPYRYVGLGGTGSEPEFIALTDGVTSIVARAGDVVGDRYRIDELRAKELVLTDLASGERGIIVLYADIQYRSPDAPPAKDAATPRPSREIEAAPPLDIPAARPPTEPARPADQEASEAEGIPDSDIRTMIAPPPVNRAEQPMPMEVTPPPEHNPMIITPPSQEVPMITTPSRREHREAVDIPLGPGN